MIRLPNPKSDLHEFIKIIAVINVYVEENDLTYFTFDDISQNLTAIGNISSQSAFGSAAIEASFRDDKSLDSVFNQSKALSEVLRLLGWITSGEDQHTFRLTLFGKYVSSYFQAMRQDLQDEVINLISYSFINLNYWHPQIQAYENLNVKPFWALLKILPRIENFITKDEFNFFIHTLESDEESEIKQTIEKIEKTRTEKGFFQKFKQDILKNRGISANTASNYTRIPLAFLKTFAIMVKDKLKNIPSLKHYLTDKERFINGVNAKGNTEILYLTNIGRSFLNKYESLKNIKYQETNQLDQNKRILAAILGLFRYYTLHG